MKKIKPYVIFIILVAIVVLVLGAVVIAYYCSTPSKSGDAIVNYNDEIEILNESYPCLSLIILKWMLKKLVF